MVLPTIWDEITHQDSLNSQRLQILSGNEAFALGALQTVSAATAFGILSQFTVLNGAAGRGFVLVALTVVVFALTFAILGAYYRHLYKLWQVVRENDRRASLYYFIMRSLLTASACAIVCSLFTILIGMWLQFIGGQAGIVAVPPLLDRV
jgi:hypothetical protein